MTKRLLSLIAFSSLMTAEAWAFQSINPCEENEHWLADAKQTAIREDYWKEFQNFLSGKLAPVRGFSDALALRKISKNDASRAFGEYWISRSLYESKIIHMAQAGMNALASRTPTPETFPFQLAAVSCLLRMQEKFGTLALPSPVLIRLQNYAALASDSASKTVVWEAAHHWLRETIARETISESNEKSIFALLSGSGAFEAHALGLIAFRHGENAKAIEQMQKFFAYPAIPVALRRYVDPTHLLTARAYYGMQEFGKAAEQFKQISKQSNDLAESLSELAWAYLLDERHGEAIGTAMNLSAGGMRRTYAPEAPMVMAMALNELCQYPESIRATQQFKRDYEHSYRWLNRWRQQRAPLYPQAVKFVKKEGDTPERIASEWVRSPLFIASQEEINLIFQEQESSAQLGKSGGREQRRLGLDIVKTIRELRPKIRKARAKHTDNDEEGELPQALVQELRGLKSLINAYRRLQFAAPYWHRVLAQQKSRADGIRKQLVEKIETDLRARSDIMLVHLNEIAENIQLIEVEIYEGASQDIIWQNAHPDYQKIAQKIENESQSSASAKVWDWGRAPAGSEETTEIWEDELGSFKANLVDNCSSKDRYLALKMKERQQ